MPMKLLKYVFGIAIVAVIAAFAFFAFTEVPVPQEETRIQIESENL